MITEFMLGEILSRLIRNQSDAIGISDPEVYIRYVQAYVEGANDFYSEVVSLLNRTVKEEKEDALS